MDGTNVLLPSLFAVLLFGLSPVGVFSAAFTFTNNCGHTVWPGILSGAGTSSLATTGFALEAGESQALDAPPAWSGRFWGRTQCSTDSSGKFTCGTGDCGSGAVECEGRVAATPTTLAEFTLDGSGGMDFYDVSLVDGFNVPMLVAAEGVGPGGGGCSTTGCLVDLNGACPADLRVRGDGDGAGAVACRSACDAFGSEEYCCSGAYGSPETCRPTAYSAFFKNACPRAYSYAFDDSTSTFTCATGANYAITFCPSTTSLKSSDLNPGSKGALPLINDTMMLSSSTQPTSPPGTSRLLLPALAVLAVFCRLSWL